MSAEHRLAYDAPAAEWLEALPLGNGRLGAMVFGGSPADGGMYHRFQLNDSSAWSGSPHSQDREPVFSREEADRILSGSRRRLPLPRRDLPQGRRRTITGGWTLPRRSARTRTALRATPSGWRPSSATIRRCW